MARGYAGARRRVTIGGPESPDDMSLAAAVSAQESPGVGSRRPVTPRRALRRPAFTSRVGRGTALIAGVPLLLALGLGGVALQRRLSADPADSVRLPATPTSWQYEVHLVVPLPTGSPARDDALSVLTLLEDRLRPDLAAVGARLDTDDEGEREFAVVAVGDDPRRLAGVLATRARGTVPAGTKVVTYRWRSDGSVGEPLQSVPLDGVSAAAP